MKVPFICLLLLALGQCLKFWIDSLQILMISDKNKIWGQNGKNTIVLLYSGMEL